MDRASSEKNMLQGMAFYLYCTYYLFVVPVTCSQIANFSSEHDINSHVCPLQYQHCNNREYGWPTMNKNRFGGTFLNHVYDMVFQDIENALVYITIQLVLNSLACINLIS